MARADLRRHRLVLAGEGVNGGKTRHDPAFLHHPGARLGLWAAWWPAELGHANTSLAAFAGHTLACFIPFFAAWLALGRVGSEWFRPAKLEMPVLLGLVALFFVGIRIPTTPRSALILPPLLLLCAYGLRRNQSQEQRPDLLEAVIGHIPPSSCLPLLLMPLTAIAVYAPIAVWGLTLPSNWVLYVITMPLG